MTDTLNLTNFVCPLPLRRYPQIVMGHGSGGQMMNELIEHLFVPTFAGTGQFGPLSDAAVLDLPDSLSGGSRLAFSADSFVVSPPVFPGGDIGSLAVHGTVNDLAVMGARPLYLSASFILEEGLSVDILGQIVQSMAAAARIAGVRVVTGDTKVVERGHGDGLYINTNGVGVIPPGVNLTPSRITPDDLLIVNGPLGDHGVAIMSLRAGLQFETEIISDSAPLNGLVAEMLRVCPNLHAMRDLTRGGLAAVVNELARDARVGLEIDEPVVPVRPAVASACEMLGLDPLHVANEGKLLAVVPANSAESVLEVMKRHPLGQQATLIGRATTAHPGVVVGRTAIGSQRVIDLPAGELLPRIC
ncbi:MAG: hydrogenase expression/formation protein HypE [Anaerolineae bacterium]|nr:hydrogenase expression/formation protein HypE [Anaerolineae bacterium]